MDHLNPRPPGSRALKTPPDPDLYRFVVRRRDRFADRIQKVNVSYKRGPAISRCITTPWDGVTAATLFLRDERELHVARGYGWRDDITGKWFAEIAVSEPIDSDDSDDSDEPMDGEPMESGDPPASLADLEALGWDELRSLAKVHGVSGRQKAPAIVAELAAILGLV